MLFISLCECIFTSCLGENKLKFSASQKCEIWISFLVINYKNKLFKSLESPLTTLYFVFKKLDMSFLKYPWKCFFGHCLLFTYQLIYQLFTEASSEKGSVATCLMEGWLQILNFWFNSSSVCVEEVETQWVWNMVEALP